jgi:hypothetical protein
MLIKIHTFVQKLKKEVTANTRHLSDNILRDVLVAKSRITWKNFETKTADLKRNID